MQNISINNNSSIVRIGLETYGFRDIFKKKPTYNGEKVNVLQTEKINDKWMIVEIEFIKDGA